LRRVCRGVLRPLDGLFCSHCRARLGDSLEVQDALGALVQDRAGFRWLGCRIRSGLRGRACTAELRTASQRRLSAGMRRTRDAAGWQPLHVRPAMCGRCLRPCSDELLRHLHEKGAPERRLFERPVRVWPHLCGGRLLHAVRIARRHVQRANRSSMRAAFSLHQWNVRRSAASRQQLRSSGVPLRHTCRPGVHHRGRNFRMQANHSRNDRPVRTDGQRASSLPRRQHV